MDREMDVAERASPVRQRVAVLLCFERSSDDVAIEIGEPPRILRYDQHGGEELDRLVATLRHGRGTYSAGPRRSQHYVRRGPAGNAAALWCARWTWVSFPADLGPYGRPAPA